MSNIDRTWAAHSYQVATGPYRYKLVRERRPGIPPGMSKCPELLREMVFIGLNPSTADGHLNDPTLRKCLAYAESHGCCRVTMLNLFAWRETHPDNLALAAATDENVIGPDNQRQIRKALTEYDNRTIYAVVACWGNGIEKVMWYVNGHHSHGKHMRKLVADLGHNLYSIGVPTNSGHPAHPLYLKGDEPLLTYYPNDWQRHMESIDVRDGEDGVLLKQQIVEATRLQDGGIQQELLLTSDTDYFLPSTAV